MKSKRTGFVDLAIFEIGGSPGIDVTAFSTLLAAIGTLVTALLIYWQIRKSAQSTLGDLILRFHNDFFFRRRNSEIIRAIEEHQPVLKGNGGKFDDEDLDDFLGIIELLDLYIKKGLLEKKMVDDMFGYYIVYLMKTRRSEITLT
jgi:hypothetical protein